MEIKNITTKQDFISYCRNITRLLDQEYDQEFVYLRELSELKFQMERIENLPEKQNNLLNHLHDFLLSDAIVGRIVRYKIDSYIKLFKI